MNYVLIGVLCACGLFAGMLLMLELGRRIGARRLSHLGEASMPGVGVVDGAILALLGLMLAFTFSGAASRFDVRRQLVVEEANDIGTAYLRLDLLPAHAQPSLREHFRQYVDSRISVYRTLSEVAATQQGMANTARLQQVIWDEAITACAAAETTAPSMLLLPALNQMIDITTTRNAAARTHPPFIIFAMLFLLALASALLAGHGLAAGNYRDWLHMLGFAVVISATVYVILDFEFPRLGLIRLDAFDYVLTDLRNGMK